MTSSSGPSDRLPDRPSAPPVTVVRWEWTEGDRRPGLPWIGIFLLVFGGLLLLQALYPELQAAGSLFFVAVGVVFLISWLVRRGTGSLYTGAIITALALPPALSSMGVISGPGWGTLSLGVAFLFIAAVRAAGGGGWGWQAWVGGILAIVGGTQITFPAFGELFWPLVILGLGIVIIVASLRGRERDW
jgi:hypothetical protein